MCCDLVVLIKVAMGSVWFDIFSSVDRMGQDAKYHNWSLNVHNYKHILIFVYHIYTCLRLTEEIYDYYMIVYNINMFTRMRIMGAKPLV